MDCPVCLQQITTLQATFNCTHILCLKCAARLIYLQTTFKCPICQTPNPATHFHPILDSTVPSNTSSSEPLLFTDTSSSLPPHPVEITLNTTTLTFYSKQVYSTVLSLLSLKCQLCHHTSPTKNSLLIHYKSHAITPCYLCIYDRKEFPYEYPLYLTKYNGRANSMVSSLQGVDSMISSLRGVNNNSNLKGVNCIGSGLKGANSNTSLKGVNYLCNEQQGVNTIPYEQQGVNISAYEQQGVNTIPYEQQGVNISAYEQQGVNTIPYEQQGLNTSTYEQNPFNNLSHTTLQIKNHLTLHLNSHPKCLFCKKHFYDTHKTLSHMTHYHYLCTLCDRLGRKHQYYNTYNALQLHYNSSHYTCKYKECIESSCYVFCYKVEMYEHLVNYHNENIRYEDIRNIDVVSFNIRGEGKGYASGSEYRGVNNSTSDITVNNIPVINSSAYANEQGYGRVTIGSNVLRITRSNTNRKITINKIERGKDSVGGVNNTSMDRDSVGGVSNPSMNRDGIRGVSNKEECIGDNTPLATSNINNTPLISTITNIPSYMDRTQSFIKNTTNINTYITKRYSIHDIYLSEQITLLYLNEISVEECCERICIKLGEKESIKFLEGVSSYMKDDVKMHVLKYVSVIKERVLFPRFSNKDVIKSVDNSTNSRDSSLKGFSNKDDIKGVDNSTSSRDSSLKGFSNKDVIKSVSNSAASRDISLKGFSNKDVIKSVSNSAASRDISLKGVSNSTGSRDSSVKGVSYSTASRDSSLKGFNTGVASRDIKQQGFNINNSKQQGVSNNDSIKGVSNSTVDKNSKQQGVSNNDNIKGVSNSTVSSDISIKSVNVNTSKQQGASNSVNKQQGVNVSTLDKNSSSKDTNTDDKGYKVIRIGRSVISIKKK